MGRGVELAVGEYEVLSFNVLVADRRTVDRQENGSGLRVVR